MVSYANAFVDQLLFLLKDSQQQLLAGLLFVVGARLASALEPRRISSLVFALSNLACVLLFCFGTRWRRAGMASAWYVAGVLAYCLLLRVAWRRRGAWWILPTFGPLLALVVVKLSPSTFA